MRQRKVVIPYVKHGAVYRKAILTPGVIHEVKTILKISSIVFGFIVGVFVMLVLVMWAGGAFGGIADPVWLWATLPPAIFVDIAIFVGMMRAVDYFLGLRY